MANIFLNGMLLLKKTNVEGKTNKQTKPANKLTNEKKKN